MSFAFTAKTLAFVVAASFVLFLLLGVLGRWAVVYSDSEATQTWKEYVLGMQGAIDGKPEAGAASVLYSAFVRLVAAIVIGGVLTSFLCALAERFSQMKLQGLLVPALRDHFVIFGYNEITNDLIRALLVPDPRSGEDFARWTPLEGALSDSADTLVDLLTK